ncbi:hypothetical protein FVF58_47480 [Paraburkholderia panacisoli]|uniref:Uncharacterized protein n=1 Tax=Paraburkholderia panacisoli TaxID=2603818 RepID=A0A5B0G3J5_9BURK|nr:hypothetical protein [Paraburkholderia panacisoli]KAA0997812.1 hypothetical protein FVF58_47480 [Paraburkholderia panacisoli]
MMLSDLLRAVGDENVESQNLDEATTHIQATRGKVRVTFGTQVISAADFVGPAFGKRMRLAFWLPRDKVDAAIAQQENNNGSRGRTRSSWRQTHLLPNRARIGQATLCRGQHRRCRPCRCSIG